MNNLKRLVVDSLLMVLLLGILVMPATSFGLLKVKSVTSSQVLSAKDVKLDSLEKLIKEKDLELKKLRLEILELRQLLETTQSTQ